MRKFKKTVASISALAFALGLAGCGGNNNGGNSMLSPSPNDLEAETEWTTTTGPTVTINTDTYAEEEKQTLEELADAKLRDVELENKVIKWFAHYDINPSTMQGDSESVNITLFKEKYGGSIEYIPTTWETRYSDLSVHVLGADGIDFFPCDTAALPKGVISGMFQPVDDYIDMSSELWADMKDAMEIYNFKGKHYELVTGVSAEQVVLYNKQTIEEYGFDDPWEMYKDGDWNWDSFTDMLQTFVEAKDENEGLDGYWSEKALFLSAGVPAITTENGSLKTNLMDPTVEKAMNWMLSLYTKGLVIDRSIYEWYEQPQFMGEGKELFYIIGAWGVLSNPDTWSTHIPPEDLGIAPVPSPAGSKPYQAATLDGWVICKGAANPQGVGLFADCTRLANTDDDAIEIADRKVMDDYSWSRELVDINKEINDLARQYPVVDLSTGISTDVAQLTTDGGDGAGLRGAMHGVEWATQRDELSEVIALYVGEADDALKNLG